MKLADTIHDVDVRHLLWLRSHVGQRLNECMILNTGPRAYRPPDGVAVVPLALLGH